MRWLSLLLLACAPARVVTRPQESLLATPTRSAARQLPAQLDVDPTKIAAPPLEFVIREPRIVTLSNGLQVYLLEDHATPLVFVRALVISGAVDEPAEKLGLASMMTSVLTTGGAGARSPQDLEDLLSFHAADLSAGAGDETSSLQLSLRSTDLDALLPVFADVLQRPRFDEKRFETARGRFIEGLRRREDRPDAVASRALSKAVFGATSLPGREPVEATVKAITIADVKKFHAATWGAKSTRLVITGDFDSAVLENLLNQHFASWKGGAPAARAWAAEKPLLRRVIVIPRKIAQAKVRIGTFGYTRRSELEYPLRLTNTVLGTFGVGRLYREIRDEKGLAYSAYSSVGPGPTSGLFIAGFDTKPEQVGDALDAATRILGNVSTSEPITDGELRTAKDVALNTFAFRFDSAAKIAFERAQLDLFGYPADYLGTWREKISAVTVEQLTKSSAQLDDGLQIIVVGPPEALGDLSRFGPVSTINDVEQFR
ncbi:MAG: M16 family metallopeptidase [Archangium sp.]